MLLLGVGEGERGREMKGQSGMASITHCATRRFFNGPTTSFSSDTERERERRVGNITRSASKSTDIRQLMMAKS